VFCLVSGSRSLCQFSSLERFTTDILMNLLLFFWLNGLFITTVITGRMTQIRYTCAQLIDLRTCAAGPPLPSDVIARQHFDDQEAWLSRRAKSETETAATRCRRPL